MAAVHCTACMCELATPRCACRMAFSEIFAVAAVPLHLWPTHITMYSQIFPLRVVCVFTVPAVSPSVYL